VRKEIKGGKRKRGEEKGGGEKLKSMELLSHGRFNREGFKKGFQSIRGFFSTRKNIVQE